MFPSVSLYCSQEIHLVQNCNDFIKHITMHMSILTNMLQGIYAYHIKKKKLKKKAYLPYLQNFRAISQAQIFFH